MKYKVGDRVKVRSGLENGRLYGEYMIDNDMLRLSGKVITITRVCSDSYQIMEDGGFYFWTDEMLEELAEGGCVHAYNLMRLAAENPEAYKGKKYKVVKGNCMDGHGNKPMAVLVSPNGVLTDEIAYNIYVTSETILEEIKPEPKPVPFMEAVKAIADGKVVYSVKDDFKHIYSQYPLMIDDNDEAVSYAEILTYEWYIKES